MQADTLTPTQRARLLCVLGECPGVDGGCTDTPPRCARYGGDEAEYAANVLYVGEIERGLAPTVSRAPVDWLRLGTWLAIAGVYVVLALAVGAIVCWRWGW